MRSSTRRTLNPEILFVSDDLVVDENTVSETLHRQLRLSA